MLSFEYTKNFGELDKRWRLWECNSHEEFISKYLIEGRFHKDVPEHILKEYRTVEYLMYYSYYYYPLYDEAFSKLTRIFEMAIDLRCEEYKIVFKSKFPTLQNRIIELSKKNEDYSFVLEWERAREVRNVFAHPKQHSFSGPISKEGVFHKYINLVNKIFTDSIFYKERDIEKETLSKQTIEFIKGLFTLQSDKNYLITGGTLLSTVFHDKILYSLWTFYPVYVSFPQKMNDLVIMNPHFYTFKDIKTSGGKFTGIDVITEKKIIIQPSQNPSNISAKDNFNNKYASSDQEVKNFFQMNLNHCFAVEIAKFEYQYFWK